VSLSAAWRAALDELIRNATPFKDQCFRSVEIAYGLPDEVISGEGTRLHGGRFAPLGVRAVFASLDEVTATREVTARKDRLGGRAQISIKSYPRFTYVIAVEIDKCVDFRSVDPSSDLGRALAAALDPSDLQVSQEMGQYLMTTGVQGAIVPSVVPPVAAAGANVIVFLDADPPPKIEIANRKDILQAIEDLARRAKK
jgi:RES domain-containing protein